VSGPGRIAQAFAASGKRAALMPYVMGGYPDPATALAIGHACVQAGADLLEVGVPFSDPLADGPVIHAAGTAALEAGTTLDDALELAGQLSALVPTVVMCYCNPILARGPQAFAAALAGAGVSGLIVPDLPLEEAPALLEPCDQAGVALVPLVAPTTPPERLAAIGARARGFLYAVSVTGTTGERASLDRGLGALLERARGHTEVPVAVGFGIATPEQAAAAADAGADGVIVASRLIRAAGEADDPVSAVGEVVAAMASALR
jgi:tryptophan synthase alpha chain